MNIILTVLMGLLGVSLVSTTMGFKYKGSLNMTFGSIVGIITVVLDLSVVVTIVAMIITMVISNSRIKHIEKEDYDNFFAKDERKTVMLVIGAIIVVAGVFVTIIATGDPWTTIPVGILIIVSFCIGIPRFVRAAKSYEQDELEDGDK